MTLPMAQLTAIAVAFGTLFADLAVSQVSPRADPFSLPTRALLCRPQPDGLGPAGVVHVEIDEEPPDSMTEPRVLNARFDSSGVVLSIGVRLHEHIAPGQDKLTGVAVQFGSPATGIRVTGDPEALIGSQRARSVPPERVPLTETEIGRARQLAAWLWTHRCRKSSA